MAGAETLAQGAQPACGVAAGRAVVLLAHGSRDGQWRQPIEAVQARLQAMQPGITVRCAYLELCPPTLEDAVQELAAARATHMAVVPLFLGAGRHVREDLPKMVQALALAFPALHITLAKPVGEDERMIGIMAQLAAEAVL